MSAARYRIEFTKSAAKALRDLDQRLQARIFTKVADLAVEPRPVGAESLQGSSDFLRIRVGDHCIIYTIEDDRLLVLVVRVAHRREAYRRLVRLRAERL